MTWTAPRTWTTGETVTSAIMNTHVRDNQTYLKTEVDTNTTDIAALPVVQSGSVSISSPTIAAGGSVNVSFTFANAFDTAPRVVASSSSSASSAERVVPRVLSVTTTGGTMYFYNVGSSSVSPSSVSAHYVAVDQ